YGYYEYWPAQAAAPPVAPQMAVAEMPRVIPQERPYEPYRPAAGYNDRSSDMDTATVIKIIVLVIKMLWLISRCS
ncbi:MAG: hypothetical protein V4581_13510, partial [Bacteroidota bacterium]